MNINIYIYIYIYEMNMIYNIYVKVLFGDHERESADSDELITSEWIPLTVSPWVGSKKR